MIDTISEHLPKEEAIAKEAYRSWYKLGEELGKLHSDQITDRNAPFIAGLLISRRIEGIALGNNSFEQRFNDPSSDVDRESHEDLQNETAGYYQILRAAQNGDFVALKEFVENEANLYQEIADDYPGGIREIENSDNALLHNIASNMHAVSRLMPESGDGAAIKVPNPAHIEKPVPLKIQLERFNAGGEIR